MAALRDISLSVAPGEIVCLLGPSGCGKTTALRVAAGLERPHAGEVHLAGHNVCNQEQFVPPEAREAGLLFQDYALFPHLSVAGNVAFGLQALSTTERNNRLRDTLQRVNLWERRDAYPHMLSGGEQQRVALARALAPQPAVLLLDKPFSNLDSGLRRQVRDDVLRVIQESSGTAAMMITHDPEEALYLGDRIALMKQGQIVQLGTPDTLYTQPASAIAAGFFGEINRLQCCSHANQVETPFGALPAASIPNGSPVDILIRTEGLQLCPPAADLPCATVTAVHRLGPLSQLRLEMPRTNVSPMKLTVHALGATIWRKGDSVGVTLEKSLAYVFPQ